jgi:hypothetical protein
MQRARPEIRRAIGLEAEVRLASQRVAERLHEPRLPDARLPVEQHDLAATRTGVRPTRGQQAELRVAIDERREARARPEPQRPDVVADRRHPMRIDGMRESPQRERAHGLGDERAGDQTARRFGDDQSARHGLPADACRQVHGVADRAVRGARRIADLTQDDESGMDADAHAELETVVALQDRIRSLEAGDQIEPRAHGAARGVLVRGRHAEVGDDAVADVLRDRAVVRPDGLSPTTRWKTRSTSRKSSGSSRSEIGVESATSQKSTERCRRSPCSVAGGGAPGACCTPPHSVQ